LKKGFFLLICTLFGKVKSGEKLFLWSKFPRLGITCTKCFSPKKYSTSLFYVVLSQVCALPTMHYRNAQSWKMQPNCVEFYRDEQINYKNLESTIND
jgi:hypothetical protein